MLINEHCERSGNAILHLLPKLVVQLVTPRELCKMLANIVTIFRLTSSFDNQLLSQRTRDTTFRLFQ